MYIVSSCSHQGKLLACHVAVELVLKLNYLSETWSSVEVWNYSIFAFEGRWCKFITSLCMGMEHPWCQLWMWYIASGNSRRDVDDTQRPGCTNTCTTADNTVYRTERMAAFELTSPGSRIFRWVVLKTLPAVTWSTERFVCAGCKITCACDHIACRTGLLTCV